MFGIEYKWGDVDWRLFEWFRSEKKRDEVIEILRYRADGISDHLYREIERVH